MAGAVLSSANSPEGVACVVVVEWGGYGGCFGDDDSEDGGHDNSVRRKGPRSVGGLPL